MPQTRQLAAIMFTDIVGYTALMGEDEQEAFELLKKNRTIQKPLIEKYGGKWIKELGDGVLARFDTATDAVLCASAIQKSCTETENIKLRIGIHLGEVLLEDGDVFGDGVNIASRIQSIASINSIWISDAVQKNISNKKEIQTRFIREESLKHVKEPVKIYEIIADNAAASKRNFNALKKPSEKSIAVLPFINMSSDPEQEYFSDGLTEEIISDLSRLQNLMVISRSSIMTFKGTSKKAKEIAGELNARYLLEGSVRKSANNLRITAQLIDAANDAHLWSEKYNGTVDDIFDIQEKVSRSIVDALKLKLTEQENSILSEHPIQDAKAHECYIRARQEVWKFTESGLDNAIALAQRGLDMIGDNALLYATLSMANLFLQHYGIRQEPENLKKAFAYSSKSLELDPTLPLAHFVQGLLAFKRGDLQEAANIFVKLLNEDQNNPDALHYLIVPYCMCGRADAARPILKKLLQVDPLTTNTYAFPGLIELCSGNIEQSMPHFKKWYQLDPQAPFTRFWYSNVLALNNKLDECFTILNAILLDTPTLVFASFAQFLKAALEGDKEIALQNATDELKEVAATLDYLPIFMAFAYALINEKEEAVKWLNISLKFGYAPYPWVSNISVFQERLIEHDGYIKYLQEIKKRSDAFKV